MTKKTRIVEGPWLQQYWNGSPAERVQLAGQTESIEGAGHNLRSLGTGDCGGPMFLSRYQHLWGFGTVIGGSLAGSQLRPVNTTLGNPPAVDSNASIEAEGTTAIARCTPTTPAFDMSVAIGEVMADGAPGVIGLSTMRDRALTARNAGGDYLSYQFGWVPLVNDVRNLCHAVRNSDQIMRSYVEGANKKQRAGYSFPRSLSTTGDSYGVFNVSAKFPGSPNGTTTTADVIVQSESRTWFSGAFVYHFPMSFDQLDRSARFSLYASQVLGIRLTPETLWNLAPWSWAADWFGNTGDVLHNVSNIGHDGLALQYGYVMRHKREQITIAARSKVSSGVTYGASTYTRITEYKTRLPSTPYGFGVDLDSLSAKQISILVALGLSK